MTAIAYQKTFSGPVAQEVLDDLKEFCRAERSTADINNPNLTYLLEGRREVWLRIQKYMNYEEPVETEKEDYEYE